MLGRNEFNQSWASRLLQTLYSKQYEEDLLPETSDAPSKAVTKKLTVLVEQYEKDLLSEALDQKIVERYESELLTILQSKGDESQSELDSAVDSAVWYNSLGYLLTAQGEEKRIDKWSIAMQLQESEPSDISPEVKQLLAKRIDSLLQQKIKTLVEKLNKVETTENFDNLVLDMDADIPKNRQDEVNKALNAAKLRVLVHELEEKTAELEQDLSQVKEEEDHRVQQTLIQQIDAQCRLLATQTAQIEKPSADLRCARGALLFFWNRVQDDAWKISRAPYLDYQKWAAGELEKVRVNDKEKLASKYKKEGWDDPKAMACECIGNRLVGVFSLIDVSQLDPALAQQYHSLYLRDLQEVDEDERFEIARKVAVHSKKRVEK